MPATVVCLPGTAVLVVLFCVNLCLLVLQQMYSFCYFDTPFHVLHHDY